MSTFKKLTIASLLLIISWTTQAAINLSDPIPINPLLKVGTLDNGLSYYIQHNSKPQNHVELRLVIKAGSILEDDDQQGLAHFLEHMAFNGSRHFKRLELISYLQSLGIKFGADLNAYTSFNETVYMLPVPLSSSSPKNLETGFLVLEDWAQGLTLNDADIDAERAIILEEARLGKGAQDRMERKLYPALFNGSKYADRLAIGKESIIRTFKYDALRQFYKDWYRPNLMAVIVVGDIEPAQAEHLVKQHFTHLKNPDNERARDYPIIPPRTTSTSLVITDSEATTNNQLIQFPIEPSDNDITLANYRRDLIKNLSFAMLSRRLSDRTQQADPPFIAGQSGISPLVHGYESYSSFALIGRAGVQSAIDALVGENERARQFGFSADELERTKRDTLRMYETAYKERDKSESASFAEEYIRHFLNDEPIPGIVNEYAYVTELLPTITLDEVNAYVNHAIPHHEAKLVAYLGSDTDGEVIPNQTQLLSWTDDAENKPVVANIEEAIPSHLMQDIPKAGSITKETHDKELGTTTLTLSNGLTVLLKPTDFKSDQILLSARRFGGQSLFDNADIYNARYANAIVESMGLNGYTPIELQKILAGKSLAFQTNSSNFIEDLTGAAAHNDIETLFQFMHLRLAAPRTDANLYSAFIERMEDVSKNALAKPESVFADTLISTLYNNNPRVPLIPKPEDFNHVSMNRAAAIFSDRFTSAQGFTFIIVGSFNVETIKPLIATYLASLPTPAIESTYHDLGIRPVQGVVKKEVYAGSEDKSRTGLIFTGIAKYSKEENMRFNALVEVINLRIIDVLREKLGFIYSGNVKGTIERVPYEHYQIAIQLPGSPDHVDAMIAAMFKEIEKLRTDGPTELELTKVKQNWIKNNQIALHTNEHWVGYFQNSVLYNMDLADILTVEKRMGDVSLEDVKGAAQRYLNTKNYVQVVLYPVQKTQGSKT